MITNAVHTVYDLIDLLSIPEYSNLIFHTINMLNIENHGVMIREFHKKKNDFRQNIFESRLKDSNDCLGLTWFELFRFQDNDWRIFNLAPNIPPYHITAEIIPIEIYHEISAAFPNTDQVFRLNGIYSSLFDRQFDLVFSRPSEFTALGTLQETLQSRDSRKQKGIETDNERMDISFKMFFDYMQKFPEIRKYFLKELNSKLHLIAPGDYLDTHENKGK